MTERIGVAISTTGDEHRLGLLRKCVAAWDAALPLGAPLFVTVDGDEDACQRVVNAVRDWTGSVFRVGQPVAMFGEWRPEIKDWVNGHSRRGVAVNKNTGLELLMDSVAHPEVGHLFLSDDDTWPLYTASLDKHIELGQLHSMVCWGHHRLAQVSTDIDPDLRVADWTWPRGVLLYTHRSVVEKVGGMDERFGLGGHEHVEWSRRIHNAGLTPAPFLSPASYATRNALGAAALWHAEDMPRPGEPLGNLRARRKALTSVKTTEDDWKHIDQIMAEREGSAAFVDYHAASNGRASATLCVQDPSRGAGGEK